MVIDILTILLAVLFKASIAHTSFTDTLYMTCFRGALIGFPSRCLLYNPLQNLASHRKGSAFSSGASK
jgi:hypothetical protein